MFGASGVATRDVLRPQPSDGPNPRLVVASATFAAFPMNSRLFTTAIHSQLTDGMIGVGDWQSGGEGK